MALHDANGQVFVDDGTGGTSRTIPATLVVTAPGRRVTLRNIGAADTYLGNGTPTSVTLFPGATVALYQDPTTHIAQAQPTPDATHQNGYLLKSTESLTLDVADSIWAVCASAASTTLAFMVEEAD